MWRRGACVVKGGMCGEEGMCMAGRGHAWQRRGCAWQGRGCVWQRACMAGGMHGMGGGMCGRGGMRDRRDGHYTGMYASYRNAFLFSNSSVVTMPCICLVFTERLSTLGSRAGTCYCMWSDDYRVSRSRNF